MLWKVLIVDDDRNFRYAMREVIPWKDNGFEVVAEVVHGRQALEVLAENEVHIVLTDMEMPVMNGVELTEAVKQQYPDMIVVALSAFDDFEFVKESMRLGAEDYILKQEFDGEKIIQALTQLCQKKLDSRSKNFNLGKENESFVAYLQQHTDTLSQSSPYQKLRNKNHMTVCFVLSKNPLEIRIKSEDNLLFFYQLKETIWVLIYQMPETSSQGERAQALLRIAGEIQAGASGRVQIALCDESGGFSQLPQMYGKAELAMQYAAYFPKERILHYLDIFRFEKTRKRDFLYPIPEDRMTVHPEDGLSVLEEMTEQIIHYKPDEEFMNGSFLNFYKEYTYGFASPVDDMDMLNFYEGLKQQISIEDKKKYTAAWMEKCQDRLKARYGGMHKGIQMAVAYVYKHYAEDISLTDIAEYAGLSENYFSNLFKKEMKENLVSFVNQVRIEKARKLLENQNLKVNEIAEAVGFRNATYLSTMFKKLTGVSISDYKNQMKNTP